MRLVYHRGDVDYGLRDYVYLWNLLASAQAIVGPIEVMTTNEPYEEASRPGTWRRLMRKGLPKPSEGLDKGFLTTTLFLYNEACELEYYWHGREAVEAELERIKREGKDHLRSFL